MASSRLPLVVVLGSTGAGKSKLAIEIAKVFQGEIISADSMQIYKGLDIITNKVSEEEQRECPHHLISYLEADYKNYNIVDFRDAAVPIIDRLHSQRILPIVVGGTNYYIESVLWNSLVDKKDSNDMSLDNHHVDKHAKRKQNTSLSSSNPLVEQQTDHKCTEVSHHQFQASCLKKQKFSEQRIHTVPDFPKDTQSSVQTPSLLQSAAEVLTSIKSSLLSSHEGIDLNAQFKLVYGQPSCLISASYPSTSSSDADFQSRALFSHSATSSCTYVSQKSDRSVSSEVPLIETSPAACPSHNWDIDYTHQVVKPTCIDHKSTSAGNNINMPAFNEIGEALNDTSLIPKCDNSLCHREGSFAERSFVDVCDSSFLTTASETTVKDEYSDAGKLQQDKPGLSCDESNGLPSSDRHGLIQNPEDYRHDRSALLKCLKSMSPTDLYSHLEVIDPTTAARTHPNNQRKIIRAIQVFYENGQTLSSILDEQHGGLENVKSGPLRYTEPCILWVRCRQPDLYQRLDSRVDEMMSRGLLGELENFHNEALRLEALKQNNSCEDLGQVYPHGVLQMIGFKEFRDYLQLSPEERSTEDGQKLLQKSISELKQATRRYAKQQVRWISNRFCNRPGPNVPPIYSVDSTDLTQWDKTLEDAIEVVRALIAGKVPDKAPEIVIPKVDTQMMRNVCDVCGGRIFLHLHEWTGHLKSKKHKSNVKIAAGRRKLSQLLTAREEMLKQCTAETSIPELCEWSDMTQA